MKGSNFLDARKNTIPYYIYEFPWALVSELVCGGPNESWAGIDCMIELAGDAPPIRATTFANVGELRHAFIKAGERAANLHAVVSGPLLQTERRRQYRPFLFHLFSSLRYLIIDFDLRSQWPQAPDFFRRCTHSDPRSICPHCWQMVQATAHLLRLFFCAKLGLPEPLWVFSGGNGLHAWFPLARDSALAERPVQEQVFEMLRNWLPQQSALLVAIGLQANALPRELDTAVSLAGLRHPLQRHLLVRGHMIKLPFSLHSRTKQPAVPLPLNAQGLPIYPDRLDRTVAIQLLENFVKRCK